MNNASWEDALTRALKTNDDGDWSSADRELIRLSEQCSRSLADIHKILTFSLMRAGYDPKAPEIVGDASDVWPDHIIAEVCGRLRGTEAIYSATTSPPMIMHTTDANGHILSVTEAWCELMGYRPDEVFGEISFDLLTEESHRRAKERHFPLLVEQGVIGNVEYDVVAKSGAIIPVVVSATIERDAFGAHTRTIVNVQRR